MRVSVFMFCLNGAKTVRRAVESVLGQSHPDVEFVVQDGGSTDGTAEILKEYGDRINLVSEPDSGPADGFSRALKRCTGEIIGSCLADEALVPDAVEVAVRAFAKDPDLSAVTRDAILTDLEGSEMRLVEGREFSLIEYLSHSYVPHFSATFFSRNALAASGFLDTQAEFNSIEFDMWVAVLSEGRAAYIPGVSSKYSIHSDQLSRQPGNALSLMKGRVASLEKLFATRRELFDSETAFRRCIQGTVRAMGKHLLELGDNESFGKWIDFSRNKLNLDTNRLDPEKWALGTLQQLCAARFEKEEFEECALLCSLGRRSYSENAEFVRLACHSYLRLNRIEKALDLLECLEGKEEWRDLLGRLYLEVGLAFERRGDLEQALECCARGESVEDSGLQSRALAIKLKLLDSSMKSLREAHDRWAVQFIPTEKQKPLAQKGPFQSRSKIKLGFSCSSLEASETLFQISNVIDSLDTDRFEVKVYLNGDADNARANGDIRYQSVQNLSSAEFVELTRADGLDILVELDGHQRTNRLLEMSQRCAPIQMSFPGYPSTTGVPEIDYLISDEFVCSGKEEAYCRETVLRLEGGCYCFQLEDSFVSRFASNRREVNDEVTIGCFASLDRIDSNQIKRFDDVLARVPNSRFVIQNEGLNCEENRQNLALKIARAGAHASRFILFPAERAKGDRAPKVDIVVDTYPCSDPWSMAAALSEGMLAVTQCGDRFSSRLGASVLRQFGREGFVAHSDGAFLDLCQRAASEVGSPSKEREDAVRLASRDEVANPKCFARRLGTCFEEVVRMRNVSIAFYEKHWNLCLPAEAERASVFKKWAFITSMPRSGTWYVKYLFHVVNHRLSGTASMVTQPPHLRSYEGLGINAFHSHAAHWLFERSEDEVAGDLYRRTNYIVEGYEFGQGLQKEVARISEARPKTVYVYRNPLDHCISMHRHLQFHVGVSMGGEVREGGFESPVDYFRSGGLRSYLKQFYSHYRVNESGLDEILMMRYETIKRSPREAFRKMFEFVLSRELLEREQEALDFAVEVVVPENLKAIERMTGGSLGRDQKKPGESHMRGGAVGSWAEIFAESDLEFLKREAAKWGIPLACFDFGDKAI